MRNPYYVDKRGAPADSFPVRTTDNSVDVDIDLCVRAEELKLIDQAAKLVGTDRSDFLIGSSLTEARIIILDQSDIFLDSQTFYRVLDLMDAPPACQEIEGMKRLMYAAAQ